MDVRRHLSYPHRYGVEDRPMKMEGPMPSPSPTDRFELLCAGICGDPKESLQRLADYVRTQPVIDMRQSRRLAALHRGLRSDDLIVSLTTEMRLMSSWFFLYFGGDILDLIASRRPPGGRPRDESVQRISRSIAANPYFRRINQRVRLYFSEVDGVPIGDVREHARSGRRVRGHIRHYGNQHLLELPYCRYPEFVGRVIRQLANMRKFRLL